MSLHIVILAAGQGTRMKSELPKVMHRLAGKPLVQHVIDTADKLNPEAIHLVYGHKGNIVKEGVVGENLTWSHQAEQLGTGHAVAQALPNIPDASHVLILYGDVPLTSLGTLSSFVEASKGKLGVLTVVMDNPTGYGRIVRDESGSVTSIVEQKDASEAQKEIKEINTGIMAMPSHLLKSWLPELSNNNAQGEYYLTDVVALAVEDNVSIITGQPKNLYEVEGVNNRIQLASLERAYQRTLAEELMLSGATLADPNRLDIRGSLRVGRDVVIDVNAVFEGEVVLGDRVVIGPNCVVRNSTLANDVVVDANCIIDESEIAENASIGPFARLRPGTELAENSKVGNFVETKKAVIGKGSKVNHLTYIGDSEIGEKVNVGAGTITCNYDGVNKYKTTIEDGVFVGSNTSLVAPVTIKKNATIGAGSTITKDVDQDNLAIARGRQRNIAEWKRPTKNK